MMRDVVEDCCCGTAVTVSGIDRYEDRRRATPPCCPNTFPPAPPDPSPFYEEPPADGDGYALFNPEEGFLSFPEFQPDDIARHGRSYNREIESTDMLFGVLAGL